MLQRRPQGLGLAVLLTKLVGALDHRGRDEAPIPDEAPEELSEVPAAQETVGKPEEQLRAGPCEESQVRAADVRQHSLGESRDENEPVHAVGVREGDRKSTRLNS